MSEVPDEWRRLALDPPRAFGPPPVSGRIRVSADDFCVEEELGFAPQGSGSHRLLRVRKRDANTEWVARELAKFARCPVRDVGFAGLKDRHAVATQWFSVPHSAAAPADWSAVAHAEFAVLEAHAHHRKLPRGALAGNRFTIIVRELQGDVEQLAERVAQVAARGAPNYFGPQRFGRDLGNLASIPRESGFVISAARSLLFNAMLAERVQSDSWQSLQNGDMANLDGRGSVFAVQDEDLSERVAQLDLHPTGPLWGRGELASRGAVCALEQSIAARFASVAEWLATLRLEQERRALRVAVRDLTLTLASDHCCLRFRLTRGSFATTVLRELIATQGELPDA